MIEYEFQIEPNQNNTTCIQVLQTWNRCIVQKISHKNPSRMKVYTNIDSEYKVNSNIQDYNDYLTDIKVKELLSSRKIEYAEKSFSK